MAKKNDWVRIHNIILTPEQRTGKLPEDTKKMPLEMWAKGHLQNDAAEIGDEVTILTSTGREERGTLVEEPLLYAELRHIRAGDPHDGRIPAQGLVWR